MKRQVSLGLKSRVARRLFALFLLAALIPVAGLAYFAYVQVGELVVEFNFRRLEQDAKAVGMSLVQRLSWREAALERLARELAVRDGSGVRRDIPARLEGFGQLEIVGREVLAELGAAQMDHLRRSKVVLRLSSREEPYLLAAIPGSTELIKGRLDPVVLWHDEEAAVRYCVLTALGAPFYCSAGLSPPPSHRLEPLAGQNAGVFPWQVDGEEHLAAYWRARMQASLASDGFVTVVSEARMDMLSLLSRFRQTLAAIVVLALALAAWLSVTQIRRQMRPLERLEVGTRKLAQGDFTSRVEVPGEDEFAILADSFNRMSASLDNKFHLLKALGELDRAILATSEMDSVVDMLLEQVPLAIPCDGAGVLRFDQEGRGRLLTREAGRLEAAGMQRSHPEDVDMSGWTRDRPWFPVDLAQAGSIYLRHFSERGATQVLVFPALVGTRFDSALVLSYRQLPERLDEIVEAGRSLADRLAVAGSSIAWEDKLYRQAHYDPLTDLPNRVMLRDRVEQALLRATRDGLSVAAMLVDLDDFKQVNDSLGHSAGDALLVSVAERLRAQARATDTVARLAGDEFVVLVVDMPTDEALSITGRIAAKLSAELARPAEISGRRVSSPASIGIALYPENATGFEDLLKAADAAMYESKHHRRGGYQFYSSRMNAEILERFELAQELREGMDRNEFFLVYQPKIDAATGRVVGAEALVRWASPKRGLVSPAHFIPVIDEIGLGARLGEWVVGAACAQMAAWDGMGCPALTVSVNVSPAQFRSGDIIVQVREALARNALAPERLELEILESTAVGESGDVTAILNELREMGVTIALDDFGTGYSSLVYLTQLPADVLKIDRGFLVNLVADERQQAIADHIISLAKALRYTVVAEGVEDDAQVRLLAAMGCDVFQGYLFSRPLKVDDFVEFLDKPPRPIPAT